MDDARSLDLYNRLSSLEAEVDGKDGLRERLAAVEARMGEMTEAFRSLRTAIYAAAGTILVAAVAVLILGGRGHV